MINTKETEKRLLIARKNLVVFRNAAKLSQEKLALLSGITQSHLSLLERGKRRLKLDQLLPLANALGIEVDDLFDTVEDENEAELIIHFHKLRRNKKRVKNWSAIETLIRASKAE